MIIQFRNQRKEGETDFWSRSKFKNQKKNKLQDCWQDNCRTADGSRNCCAAYGLNCRAADKKWNRCTADNKNNQRSDKVRLLNHHKIDRRQGDFIRDLNVGQKRKWRPRSTDGSNVRGWDQQSIDEHKMEGPLRISDQHRALFGKKYSIKARVLFSPVSRGSTLDFYINPSGDVNCRTAYELLRCLRSSTPHTKFQDVRFWCKISKRHFVDLTIRFLLCDLDKFWRPILIRFWRLW